MVAESTEADKMMYPKHILVVYLGDGSIAIQDAAETEQSSMEYQATVKSTLGSKVLGPRTFQLPILPRKRSTDSSIICIPPSQC